MTILKEIDDALFAALSKSDAPRSTLFVVVLSNEARNDYMQHMSSAKNLQMLDGVMAYRYRGAVVSVTHDKDLPRVSVFSRIGAP